MLGLGLRGRARNIYLGFSEALQRFSKPRLIFRNGENLDVVFSEPHDMPMGDRIMLYALIRGLKPRCYLEIGVRWGGSSRIVAAAMEANGFGQAVGLDPYLGNFRPRPKELHDRVRLVTGYSPEDIGKAVQTLSAAPDFVFVDAVHTYAAVKHDLTGVMPVLAESAHILFHDAFHQGVNQAVDELLAGDPGLIDMGVLSRNADIGAPVSYGGLRLLRKGSHDFRTELLAAHDVANAEPPVFDKDLWDYDEYTNRIGNPLGRKPL